MIVRLLNDSEKHNKVWSAELTNNNGVITVETKWGRLGTKGQSKTETFYSEYEAKHAIEKKRNEKERKGYFEVEESDYFLKQLEAEIVGSECKIGNLHFVEPIEPNWQIAETDFEIIKPKNLNDPSYNPKILCTLQLRGGISRTLIITLDAIYDVVINGTTRTNEILRYWLSVPKKLDEESTDPIIQKLLEKAPAIVHAIFNRPRTINESLYSSVTISNL